MATTDAFAIDGLAALDRAVADYPAQFNAAAQAVASGVATRLQTRALSILQAKLRGRNPITIITRVDAPNRQVLVEANAVQNRQTATAIHLWFEYGTVERAQQAGRRTGKIQALHYMRDATDSARAGYPRDVETALSSVIRSVFG